MFVSVQMLSKECNVSTRTILRHAAKIEERGIPVKSRMGKPVTINRERFMREIFPGWKEGENGLEKE